MPSQPIGSSEQINDMILHPLNIQWATLSFVPVSTMELLSDTLIRMMPPECTIRY